MPTPIEIIGAPIHFEFSGKTALNRTLKSSMTERLCTYSKENFDQRGKPTEAYCKAYEEWGKGHIGIVNLGNIPIHREHLEAAGNAVIDKDSTWDPVEAFKPAISAAKANGSLCIGQLTHGGRQVSSLIRETPLSASDNPPFDAMGMHFNESKAMTVEDIKDAIGRYAYGAKVLYDAGADGAQLHAAHGYLLSQFLSPKTNRRDDDYGGESFDNRSRIVFEIIDEIRKAVPDTSFMLSIKINSHDFIEGGFGPEECQEMIQRLETARVDLIELSGGTYEQIGFEHKTESTARREGYFTEFADQITPHVKHSKICVTGGFRNIEPMAKAISDGTCDMIGLARPLCAEPNLPFLLLTGKSTGAKENKVPALMQTPAAVLQIHCFAEGRPILELSSQDGAAEVVDMIMGKKAKRAAAYKFDYPEM